MSNELPNLYTALNLEIAAVARYQNHQERTSDPVILALLQGLMRNEDGHERELIHQIGIMGGDVDAASSCPGPVLPGMVYEGTEVSGQKTNLAMLRADFAFEMEATKTYHQFASESSNNELKALFIELSKAERGHVNGLRSLIQGIEQGTHPIAFFCPVCGWSVDFGSGDEMLAESRCKMCGATFVLSEVDGDYQIDRK
jgi:rubrerythrin